MKTLMVLVALTLSLPALTDKLVDYQLNVESK